MDGWQSSTVKTTTAATTETISLTFIVFEARLRCDWHQSLAHCTFPAECLLQANSTLSRSHHFLRRADGRIFADVIDHVVDANLKHVWITICVGDRDVLCETNVRYISQWNFLRRNKNFISFLTKSRHTRVHNINCPKSLRLKMYSIK